MAAAAFPWRPNRYRIQVAGAASVVQSAIDNYGRIDAVVNNAGISRDGMFREMSAIDWQAVLDVHLGGSFHLSRAAAPHFREQGAGAFVHMTSTSGLIGNVGHPITRRQKWASSGCRTRSRWT